MASFNLCYFGEVKGILNYLQTSESVSLDLLTYSDLEVLRQKKSGMSSSLKSGVPTSHTNHLMSKRYLILTYTVEFDR